MSKCICRFLAAVLCALVSLPAVAQDAAEPPSESLLADAATYAEAFGVSIEAAVQRLRLQTEAGLLDAALQEEQVRGFAGLWIEHRPSFLVVVAFRDPAAARSRVEELVQQTHLAGFVELRRAERSLPELHDALEVTQRRLQRLALRADIWIDVRSNRVKVFTVDAAGLRRALAAARVELPAAVTVEEVPALSEPATTVIGGQPATNCTWGFTVGRSNGDVGILTAAHCDDIQSYAGVNLPFRAADQEGDQDVQWHSACDIFDVNNQFESGIGVRSVIGTRSRAQQAVGTMVWKYGTTTGRTWGDIVSKTFAPWWVTNAQSTFIYVDGDPYPKDFIEGGDSGGPVFVEDVAYGIAIGLNSQNKDGIYMAINYVSSLGVSVLTHDPAANCVICGDGVCETGESCSFDCGVPCGDGICEPGESCSLDCGGECGNGICESGETETCGFDCGCAPCIICPC